MIKNKNKIFKQYLNKNSKTVQFNIKKDSVGSSKYLPAFSKEWNNTVYLFNKNILGNIPVMTNNINKIIKSYFNLFFKNYKDLDIRKFILLKRRRNFLRKIFISIPEIKHANDKIIINLYILNREIDILKKKYFNINKKINNNLLNKFFTLYKYNIYKILILLKKLNSENKHIFFSSFSTKKNLLKSKFIYWNKLQQLKSIYLKKVWIKLINNYYNKHLIKLRKYNLIYSLNKLKFNKLSLLSVLSSILKKLIPKKIEYNFVNLKYLTNSPDMFTNVIALKLKKNKIQRLREVSRVLNRTNIPLSNTIKERTFIGKNFDIYKNQYKDLKVISNLNNNENLENKTNKTQLTKDIYTSIKYKNIAGIRIEVKGRLTKRYRADRSVYSLRWKGGLKNIDSSYQKMSTVLWRGNIKSNTTYSISTSKRRIGAFAVKGWLGGK